MNKNGENNLTIGFIKEFLETHTFDDHSEFIEKLFENENIEVDPEFHLFLWAIFANRIEIAELFWKIGKVFFF